MNFKILRLVFFTFFFFQLLNCESKSSDDEEKLRATAGFVLNRILATPVSTSSTATGTGTTTTGSGCADSAPAFSTLASAGVNTNCARSGCHVGSSPQNGLDMTSYSSVISKVNARNASSSVLYQKINGGSMQTYTTSTITTAVFCWIQGGALP